MVTPKKTLQTPMDLVKEAAGRIASMEVRGAGNIAREASSALSSFAEGWSGKEADELIKDLKWAAGLLIGTRPTAVSLRNGVLLTLSGAEVSRDVEGIRSHVISRSREFVEGSLEALKKIAKIGKGRVPKGSTVMTHCNSSAALSTIEAAFNDGRVERVYATESRPFRQGHLTVRWLAERKIPVTLIVDSAARHVMNEMDIVLVGADTVAANGALINKIGTSMIALAAHEARTPFIVCAETFKFSRETLLGSMVEIEDRGPAEVADPLRPEDLPGVDIRNPVFDATPPEYIDAIVTEIGIISPYSASEVIRSMFGLQGASGVDRGKEDFSWL